MAKKINGKRKEYTKDDVKLLKAHSKARTPVAKLSKLMKRSEGSLRQKARTLEKPSPRYCCWNKTQPVGFNSELTASYKCPLHSNDREK